MENIDRQNELIFEYSQKVQEIVHELEGKIDTRIQSCMIYYGDITIDGKETEGTKVSLSVEEDEKTIEFGGFDGEVELSMTPQEIIQNYHDIEAKLKSMMAQCVGLDHITNIYLKLIEEEKREARKALSLTDESYHKLL